MTAAATDPVGVQSVQFQVFYLGVWFTFCTDNTASYTCTGDSTQVPDGTYQTRVIATDTLNHATDVGVDDADHRQHAPERDERQTRPTAARSGRIDAGDTITFTWSEPMAPASILTGWSGASQADPDPRRPTTATTTRSTSTRPAART